MGTVPESSSYCWSRVCLKSCNTTNFLVYRNADVVTRQKYVNLVNSVKDSKGNVHIFSSMHVSGEREYLHFAFERCFRYLTLVLHSESTL